MKLYKITLYVSLIFFVILTVASIVLNCFELTDWSSFAVNWCVGVACSFVVVVITTFIQFKLEQKRLLIQIGLAVRTLLFNNEENGFIFDDNFDKSDIKNNQLKRLEQKWCDVVQSDIKHISNLSYECEFIFKPKRLLQLQRKAFAIRIQLVGNKSPKEKHESIQNDVISLAEEVMLLKINKYDKEEIERYILTY